MFKKVLCPCIFLLIAGCSSSKESIQNSNFEKEFGSANTQMLTKFVADFEQLVLTPNYPKGSISEKYEAFVSSCLQIGAYEALPKNDVTFKEFRSSQAWNEIYAQVDSTWIGEYEQVLGRVIYHSENGNFELSTTGYPTNRISNIDSLRTDMLNRQIWNYRGKYVSALNQVKKSNDFIREYCRIKEQVGEISTRLFCNLIQTLKPNLDNPLIRKIIVVEIAREYVS